MWLQTRLKEKKTKMYILVSFLDWGGGCFAKNDLGIGFLARKTLQKSLENL